MRKNSWIAFLLALVVLASTVPAPAKTRPATATGTSLFMCFFIVINNPFFAQYADAKYPVAERA